MVSVLVAVAVFALLDIVIYNGLVGKKTRSETHSPGSTRCSRNVTT